MFLTSKTSIQIVSFSLLLAMLTSCAKAPQASCKFNSVDKNVDVTKEIAIVIAPNSGFVDFENVLASTLPKIQGLFRDKKNATLSVVLADGNPEIESSSIIEVEKPFSSQTDIDDEVENAISEISRVYRCALGLDGVSSGASGESNLSLALSKAAGTFETSGTQREIFVLSNGISTAGQINFASDGVPTLEGYADKVGGYEKALVDLGGANVTWIGLGQTDGAIQEEFDTQVIDALSGFWSLFIERSNGIVGSVKQGNVVRGTPDPNSLAITAVGSGFQKICVSQDLGKDDGVVFKEYSVEFKDDSIARKSIEEVANLIIRSSCIGQVLVTGYVSLDADESSPDRIGDKDLSKKRANAVSEVLIEFGVPADKIKTVGAGWGGFDEWDPDGTYNNVLGEKNRIVKIQEQE